MTDGNHPISKDILWEDYYENLHSAYRSMKDAIKQSGLSQNDLAALLDCDKGQMSRRLKGSENLTYKTLSFMATAMKHRLLLIFVPYAQVGAPKALQTAGSGSKSSVFSSSSTSAKTETIPSKELESV